MIIGVCGLISSGKGTLGDILEDHYSFSKESFAKPLKDVASIIFNWDRKMIEGDTKESRLWREKEDTWWTEKLGKPITPRLVLQLLGTEAGRNVFGAALWSSSLINRLDKNKDYVITDVRFENEIKDLRKAGAFIVRVKRGSDPKWLEFAKRIKAAESDSYTPSKYSNKTYLDEFDSSMPHVHRSEWDWANSKIDYVINNDKDLAHLNNEVSRFMSWLSLQPKRISHF